MKKTYAILKGVFEKVNPPKEDLKKIDAELKKFLSALKTRLKKLDIKAEIFVGGSYAKKTLIKKGKYDVDIFLRYDKSYKSKEISYITKKMLEGFADFSEVHGSRDYFKIENGENFFFELIPVIKIKKPEESQNITDLSYSHVKYVNKKIKSRKILEDIKVAKAFCHAKNCYGAESYIKGFSGYGLELLVYYYGGFVKFLKGISKIKNQEVIDIEKLHRNKKVVLMDLNESKLFSPIILIDPTYKQRNALAALSAETFKKFQKECRNFLKNPSIKDFEVEIVNLEKVKKSLKKNEEFILLEARTEKQEGDIAGGKLLKFFKHLTEEISVYFEIKKKGFDYREKKTASYFFVVKSRGEILVKGPFLTDKKNVQRFKKKHRKSFVKSGRVFAREKIKFNLKEFIEKWKKKNKKKIEEMKISSIKLI